MLGTPPAQPAAMPHLRHSVRLQSSAASSRLRGLVLVPCSRTAALVATYLPLHLSFAPLQGEDKQETRLHHRSRAIFALIPTHLLSFVLYSVATAGLLNTNRRIPQLPASPQSAFSKPQGRCTARRHCDSAPLAFFPILEEARPRLWQAHLNQSSGHFLAHLYLRLSALESAHAKPIARFETPIFTSAGEKPRRSATTLPRSSELSGLQTRARVLGLPSDIEMLNLGKFPINRCRAHFVGCALEVLH